MPQTQDRNRLSRGLFAVAMAWLCLAWAPVARGFLDFAGSQFGGIYPFYRSLGVTTAPGSRYVYATSLGGNAVVAFGRDEETGLLDIVDFLSNGVDGVGGMVGASGVAVSWNGASVYVASQTDNALAAFARNPLTGALTFLMYYQDGVDGVDGLQSASTVSVNPDGTQGYVTGFGENALAVFARDPVSGLLSETQVLRNGVSETAFLQPTSVTTTPNGYAVYVAGAGVAVLQRDFSTGILTKIDDERDAGGKSIASDSVVVSPDARHLYATDWYSDRVICFTIDPGFGTLSYASEIAGGAAAGYPAHSGPMAMSPEGARVYVVRSNEAELDVYLRDPASGALSFEEVRKDGQDGVTGYPDPTDVAASDDGRFVYSTTWGADSITTFATPDLLVYERSLTNNVAGVSGLDSASTVVVSPDGKHVYAAGAASSIAIFDRHASGSLAFQSVASDGGAAGSASLALTPDGTSLLATGRLSDSLALFSRNPATGTLQLVDERTNGGIFGSTGLNGAAAVAVSPDGLNAYVAASQDDAVSAWEIASGSLGFLEAKLGIGNASAVAVSPDGGNVYVTSASGAVAVFQRTQPNGTLAPLDEVHGVDGLAGARAVVVSPDGQSVYVAGESDDAIVVFERAGSGLLGYVETERGGVSGWRLPGGAAALAVSPDGSQVYAADIQDGSVLRFARDPGSGALRFLELEIDRAASGLGFGGADALAVSPDGGNLYAATSTGDSVLVFSTVPEPGSVVAEAMAAVALFVLARRRS